MSAEIQKRESRADPWTDLDRAFDEMREHLLGGGSRTPFLAIEGVNPGWLRSPRTDVTDTGDAYRIVAEVPGIPKEQLDIRVRGTNMEIRGESSAAKEEKNAEYVHRERTYAGYYRSFDLPEPVVATEAKAKVENGLLELELPKQHPTPSNAEVKVAVQ